MSEENRAEEADTDFTRTVIVEADAHKPATGVGRNVMVDPAIHRERFVDNSDGTVTDTDTGLMWQKEDDGQLRPFADARHYCCDLNLGDHRDWRLPTIDELRSVSSHWKQLFDKPKEDELYWSSTIMENPHWSSDKWEGERYAAKVLFSSGAGNQYFLYYEYYTRAVRDIAVGHSERSPDGMKWNPGCFGEPNSPYSATLHTGYNGFRQIG